MPTGTQRPRQKDRHTTVSSTTKYSLVGVVVLATVALLVRLPFFFVDVIDWDESTFVLMGQSLLDGDLPYVVLWDNKPPLCFVAFAAFIATFGKSIVGIRVAGWVCVVVTALLVWMILRRITTNGTGFIGGVLCVLLLSFASRAQATMSETVAVVPLTAGLALLLSKRPSALQWGLVGICWSISALIRLNLVLVPVVAFGILSFSCLAPRGHRRPSEPLGLMIGGMVPLLLVALPYALAGELTLFWRSVFLAPLAYAFGGLVRGWRSIQPEGGFLGAAAGILPVVAHKTLAWDDWDNRRRFFWSWFLLTTITVVASILISGRGTAHYWIQAHPFSAVLIALALRSVWKRWPQPRIRFLGVFLAISIVAIVTHQLIPAYGVMWNHRNQGWPVVHGPAVEIARYLESNNPESEPVFLMSHHVAYWFLEQRPLSRASVHPSVLYKENLLKAFLGPQASSLSELNKILSAQPRYIVKPSHTRFANTVPEAASLLEKTLKHAYQLEARIHGLLVYRRRDRQEATQ